MPPNPENPVLVIQPRRLGDLILTFPLLIQLKTLYPENPVWVAAQEIFFRPLMQFAPTVTFFPVSALSGLGARQYETVINLGNDAASARCAAACRADTRYGPIKSGDQLLINGYWQLYREGLTQNNRHNPFHWADLFGLDLGLSRFTGLRPKRPGRGRIGIFTGASESAKRPQPLFWARLARKLANLGFKPVLLGGPAEEKMGAEIMAKGAKAINFCGKTDLTQLAVLLKSLDLLITPDTGPMHLADWLSVPVLNLSMGNVSAAETGPISPGQHILRAALSCAGCWQCSRERLFCHQTFSPEGIARVAASLVAGNACPAPPGLELLQSGRDDLGLYRLKGQKDLRAHLEQFWQSVFLYLDSKIPETRLTTAASALQTFAPKVTTAMRATFGKMLAMLAHSQKWNKPLPEDFWRSQPWHSRLFAGNLHMRLQNSSFSRESVAKILTEIDFLQAVLAEN